MQPLRGIPVAEPCAALGAACLTGDVHGFACRRVHPERSAAFKKAKPGRRACGDGVAVRIGLGSDIQSASAVDGRGQLADIPHGEPFC